MDRKCKNGAVHHPKGTVPVQTFIKVIKGGS